MDENVSGCYAQKPLKSIERILRASSARGDAVLDLFAHSGTTLLAAEILDRVCLTADLDPVYCEITIRRLEHYRSTGKLGWQHGHAFERDLPGEEATADTSAPGLERREGHPPHPTTQGFESGTTSKDSTSISEGR